MMRNLLGIALAGLLALGVAASASAATLSYTGTLGFGIATLPRASGTGSGSYVGPTHISTISFTGSQFGPVNVSLPVTSNLTIQSVRISNLANLTGILSGLSAGPPAQNPMGLSGFAKICLIFASCQYAQVGVPLTPTANTGLGIGGTQQFPGGVALTMSHNPWTIGQPVMTIHTPGTTVTTPTLPGGIQSPFSSTAVNSGVLQLVTASKVYTSLEYAIPELPVFSVLRLHFFGAPPTTTTTLPPEDCKEACKVDKKACEQAVKDQREACKAGCEADRAVCDAVCAAERAAADALCDLLPPEEQDDCDSDARKAEKDCQKDCKHIEKLCKKDCNKDYKHGKKLCKLIEKQCKKSCEE